MGLTKAVQSRVFRGLPSLAPANRFEAERGLSRVFGVFSVERRGFEHLNRAEKNFFSNSVVAIQEFEHLARVSG
jgi:hypothetical protein